MNKRIGHLSGRVREQLFHTYTLLGREAAPEVRLENILSGWLKLDPHPVVHVGTSPVWDEDPLNDANWRFQYHSLVWLDRVREAAVTLDSGEGIQLYRDHLYSWIQANDPTAPMSDYAWFDMGVGVRVIVLAFAIDCFGYEEWLVDALAVHGNELLKRENYDSKGNHGLHQDLGLIVAAQILHKRNWLDVATSRLLAMFDEAIDDEGVSREGCIDYQYRNYRWYKEALVRLAAAGVKEVDEIGQRLRLMPEFLAHATAPSGEYVLLGDTLKHRAPRAELESTYADWPRERSKAPSHYSRVYNSGYLFARTSWALAHEDYTVAYLTQRFGPGRSSAVHGHEDGGSVTLDLGNESLLRDSGLYAYEAGESRLYFRGRSSHNVIDVLSRRYYPSAETELIVYIESDSHYFTTIRNRGLKGVEWFRTMLWLSDIGCLLIDDRVKLDTPDEVIQRWHVPADSRVTTVASSTVEVNTPGGNQLLIHTLDEGISARVDIGARNPLSGWLSTAYREMIPAPTVGIMKMGNSVRFSTGLSYGRRTDEIAKVIDMGRTSHTFKCTLDYRGFDYVAEMTSQTFSVKRRRRG